jgi:hypothetical protein
MVVALAGAAPPDAERNIAVAPDESWKHAETGMVLLPQLAGLPRTTLTDATRTERDVTARFQAPDESLSATIYVFHPVLADVGVWFDSAQAGLEASAAFRNATRTAVDPVRFTAGTDRADSSLRQVYTTSAGTYRSTALAVVPVGEWIVSFQLSTKVLTASQLEARLREVIGAVRWPAPKGLATWLASAVTACRRPLEFPVALAEPTGVDGLRQIAAQTEDEGLAQATPHPIWCREGAARREYSVYRPDRGAAAYVLLVNETGGVVSVYSSAEGAAAKGATYSVSLTDVDGTVSAFPSFSSLPTPGQVWQLIGSGKHSASVNGVQLPAAANSR